jgi:glycosidase
MITQLMCFSHNFKPPHASVHFILIISLAITWSCDAPSETSSIDLSQNNYILGDATPITLGEDSTVIHIEDYILDYQAIKNIQLSDGLAGHRLNDSTLILTGSLTGPLGLLTFEFENIKNSILLKASAKKEVRFAYTGEAENFAIKGDFNAWNPSLTQVTRTAAGFEIQLMLDPGRYQYLFIVDGVEMKDPSNPDSIGNGSGGWNSFLEIPRPEAAALPMLDTKEIGEAQFTLESARPFDQFFVLWENISLEEPYVRAIDKQIIINIPEEAARLDRSHIRVWSCNDDGISNEVLVPLSGKSVLRAGDQLNREDWHSAIMYFMMIDRFVNGNPDNDEPVDNPEILPEANYYGGDLAGVTQKIRDQYFKELGFNTLWLSPITQNPKGAYGMFPDPPTKFAGYHGYWPVSSSQVDYRYGTPEELRSLLSVAHQNEMNVLLDYVANHVHELHPVYQKHPEWATNLYLEDGRMNTQLWDEQRLTTWFDTFMPTLDLRKPEVVDPMTDSAMVWLTEYNFDGFRHDATKHIDLLFWRELTKKIKRRILKDADRRIYQVGETYGSRELIASYINTGMLDAQFDFNMYQSIIETFGRDNSDMQTLAAELQESLAYYGDHHLMVNITGNQDKPRFISLADGSLDWSEDTKLAGWTREIENKGEEGFRKLAGLCAFTFAIPGIPCLYYGDEIGMPGGNDPDNRRMMLFEGLNEWQKGQLETIRRLSQVRSENLALLYGSTEVLLASGRQMALRRKYFDNEVIILFHQDRVEGSFDLSALGYEQADMLDPQFGSEWAEETESATLSMKPFSFEFLIVKS